MKSIQWPALVEEKSTMGSICGKGKCLAWSEIERVVEVRHKTKWT